MTKFALLLVASAAMAAPALATTPISFERDGIAYAGTLDQQGDVQHIVGHEVASGRPFDLFVKHGRVSGLYDGMQVSYTAPVRTQLASR